MSGVNAQFDAARLAKFQSRRRVNQFALFLSLSAMAFGLVWLVWILWETVRLGTEGLGVATFTQMTPGPNEPGGLANALYGSAVMVLLKCNRRARTPARRLPPEPCA